MLISMYYYWQNNSYLPTAYYSLSFVDPLISYYEYYHYLLTYHKQKANGQFD